MSLVTAVMMKDPLNKKNKTRLFLSILSLSRYFHSSTLVLRRRVKYTTKYDAEHHYGHGHSLSCAVDFRFGIVSDSVHCSFFALLRSDNCLWDFVFFY